MHQEQQWQPPRHCVEDQWGQRRNHALPLEGADHTMQQGERQGDGQHQAQRPDAVIDQRQADTQAGQHHRQQAMHRTAGFRRGGGGPQSQRHQYCRQHEQIVAGLA
ncbi:hypothetical protein D3C71_1071270 [compost metagenome]